MTNYEPKEYDMITFMDLPKGHELLKMGIVEKLEYMVLYVFTTGNFVIYREENYEEFERVIKKEYTNLVWYLDNPVFDADSNYLGINSSDIYNSEAIIQLGTDIADLAGLDNYFEESKFKEGDLIIFNDLNSINTVYKHQLVEGMHYVVKEVLKYGNGMVIYIGNERTLTLYDDIVNHAELVDIHDEVLKNLDNFLNSMLESNRDRVVEVMIDNLLEERKYEKIKLLQEGMN